MAYDLNKKAGVVMTWSTIGNLEIQESNELSVSRFEMMLQTKSFQGGKGNRCCKLFHLSQRADLERFQGFLVENSNVYKLLDYGLAIQW